MPWSDYPESASNNARRALKHRDENGSDCGTRVGWERANQLAGREALRDETVKSTFSFLSRAEVYDTGSFTDEDGNEVCGSVMYAAWGGDSMKSWAEKTVAKIDEENSRAMIEQELKMKIPADQFRHIQNIEEDEDSITITFAKPEAMSRKYKDKDKKKRAEPGDLSTGDFVSWNNSGGRARGRITRIEEDGTVEADSGFEVTGTPDDPAALISVYELNEDSGMYEERDPALVVAHRFSTLTKEDPAEFRASKNTMIMEYRYKPAEQAGTKEMERRTYPVEVRMSGGKDGNVTITGYAALFDELSEVMFGFVERIAPGAFDDTDMTDVRALFNHDPNFVLGRTTNGTLKLETDERGLKYTITPPATQTIRDLVIEPMKRGDITQSSFGFTISADSWEEEDGDMPTRVIRSVHTLYDVSPVTFPAYRQTDATARSLLDFQQQQLERGGPDDTGEEATETGPDTGQQDNNNGEEPATPEWAEKIMVSLKMKEL